MRDDVEPGPVRRHPRHGSVRVAVRTSVGEVPNDERPQGERREKTGDPVDTKHLRARASSSQKSVRVASVVLITEKVNKFTFLPARRGGSCFTKLRLFIVAKRNRHISHCARARFETYRNAREIESEPTVRSNESFHIVLILEIRRIVGRSLSWSVAHVVRIHKAHAFKRKCDFELSRVVLSVARWVPVPSRCAAFARAFVIRRSILHCQLAM